ncbi:MAG: protein kinase, partial [Chloroflexota bacterium]
LDVAELDQVLTSSQDKDIPSATELEHLQQALNLYQGEFLAGLNLKDSQGFEEWLLLERERLHLAVVDGFERLVNGYLILGDYQAGIAPARRLLQLDPWRESAHRQLMELQARTGQQAAALQQYRLCVELLDEELGLDPSEETTQLYQRIQAGEIGLSQAEKIIANRFEIDSLEADLLGEGGMGLVYRAADTETNQTVVVKALRANLVAEAPNLVARFVREGEALRQLNHPNIVKMVTAVEEDGQHYLVMEYVPGGSLEDLLSQKNTLPLNQVLAIALELTDALTRAHHLNIIHRDLKPANILLASDGTPRLTDFGVARLGQAERMTQSGMILGTVDYLPPEMLNGKPIDTRADIWAFGVLLFEMLTGQRPFLGDTLVSIMMSITTKPPPDLWELRPDLPPALITLIERMLEKSPEQRLSSTRLLGAELEALITGQAIHLIPQERLPEPNAVVGAEPQERPEPVTHISPLPAQLADEADEATLLCVAREQELTQLTNWLNQALVGQSRMAFIIGEAGQGKTTLIEAFKQQALAQSTDLIIVTGNCNAYTGTGDPYLPFREILEMLTSDVEARRATGVINREQAKRLWDFTPQVIEMLINNGPDLIDIFVSGESLVGQAHAVAPPEASWLKDLEQLVTRREDTPTQPAINQAALFQQYSNVIVALAQAKPLLLVLDDLQWADSGSIDLILHLGRQLKTSQVFIVGLYRDADVAQGRQDERHPLETVINELKRLYGSMQLDLNQSDGERFVGAFLDSEPHHLGPQFQQALFQYTEGHALFTVETLRDMQARGELIQDEDDYWVEGASIHWDQLPARVEGVIGERIDRLPASLKEILQIASIQGGSFVAEIVAKVLQQSEREIVRQLSGDLNKQHHLVEVIGSQRLGQQRLSQYRFQHILFQTYLYNDMDEVERSYLHEEVALILEALYQGRTDVVAGQLARHFLEAGLVTKAVDYFQQAGDQAIRRSANKEAITYLTTALLQLETLPDTPERARKELQLQVALFYFSQCAPEVQALHSSNLQVLYVLSQGFPLPLYSKTLG